jgi:hypothetical protein
MTRKELMSRWIVPLILTIGSVLWLALGPCGRHDVTSDRQYWGGYVPGATYRLLVNVKYVEERGGFISTLDGYNSSDGTIVLKGVRVQLDRIELEKDFQAGDQIYFMGHFVDGPFGGRKISLDGITMATAHGDQLNPKVLELVP